MIKYLLAFATSLSLTAFAQENTTTAKRAAMENGQSGLYLGAEYMNITDIHMDYTFTDTNYSNRTESGTHLGMAGVRLGYNYAPDTGIGFSAGLRFLDAFNKSETGEDPVQVLIPEANLNLGVTRVLLVYVGANAGIFSGNSTVSKYKTEVGGQVGMGLRMGRGLALNAGYTILREKFQDTDIEGKVQLGGFNSNLTYTF